MSVRRPRERRLGLRGAASGMLLLALAVAGPVRAQDAAAPAKAAKPDAKDAKKDGDGNPLGQLSFNSSNEPIHVKSDELEFDYQANKVVYRGTVNVVQGDVAIDCKELVVNLARGEGKDDNLKLQEVVAIGDVVITQGARKATGGRAVFDQVKRQVTLLENPVLRDGPNEVAGERIIVFLDENRSVVESSPKKRVSAILYPGSGKNGESGKPGKAGEKTDVAQQEKAPAAAQGAKP